MILTRGVGRGGPLVTAGLGRAILGQVAPTQEQAGTGPDEEEEFLKASAKAARERYKHTDTAPSPRPEELAPGWPPKFTSGDGLQAIGDHPVDIDVRIAVQKLNRRAELERQEAEEIAALIAIMFLDDC